MVAGFPGRFDILLVLKEDNLAGETVINDVSRHPQQDYSANAYRIQLQSSTEIIDENGNKSTYDDIDNHTNLFLMNRKTRITTKEDWTETWTELDRYLRYQPRFLPSYTAETIELFPYRLEDFIDFQSPLSESKLAIFTFHQDESDLTFISTADEELRSHLGSREKISWESFSLDDSHPLRKELNLDPFKHIVLSRNGKEILTDDWEDIVSFFKERELQ